MGDQAFVALIAWNFTPAAGMSTSRNWSAIPLFTLIVLLFAVATTDPLRGPVLVTSIPHAGAVVVMLRVLLKMALSTRTAGPDSGDTPELTVTVELNVARS